MRRGGTLGEEGDLSEVYPAANLICPSGPLESPWLGPNEGPDGIVGDVTTKSTGMLRLARRHKWGRDERKCSYASVCSFVTEKLFESKALWEKSQTHGYV